MKNVMEMRRQLAAKKDEARTLFLVESRSKEQSDQLDALLSDIEKRAKEIEDEERNQKILMSGGRGTADNSIMLRPEQRVADFVREASGKQGEEELRLSKLIIGQLTNDWKGATREQMAYRDAQSGNIGELGGIVVPNSLSAEIIDLARNQARVMQAGARTIVMDTRGLTIPAVKQDASAQWRGEGEEITPSVIKFSERSLEAKTLAALVEIPIELLEDSPLAEETIRRSLAEQLGLGLDYAALFGSGVGSQPLGLFNTAGVGVNFVDMTTNGQDIATVRYAPFSRALQKIAEANGVGTAAIYSPRTAFELDRLVEGNSSGQPLNPLPSFNTIQHYMTNQVRNDLEYGTADDATAIFVGDWSQMGIGMRTNLMIEATRTGTGFSKMMVQIRAYLRADVTLLRPSHFSIIRGIIAESE